MTTGGPLYLAFFHAHLAFDRYAATQPKVDIRTAWLDIALLFATQIFGFTNSASPSTSIFLVIAEHCHAWRCGMRQVLSPLVKYELEAKESLDAYGYGVVFSSNVRPQITYW